MKEKIMLFVVLGGLCSLVSNITYARNDVWVKVHSCVYQQEEPLERISYQIDGEKISGVTMDNYTDQIYVDSAGTTCADESHEVKSYGGGLSRLQLDYSEFDASGKKTGSEGSAIVRLSGPDSPIAYLNDQSPGTVLCLSPKKCASTQITWEHCKENKDIYVIFQPTAVSFNSMERAEL